MKLPRRTLLMPVASGITILLLWHFAVELLDIRVFVLPGPLDILDALGDEWDKLGRALLDTGFAATLGFTASAVAGLLFAVSLAISRWLRAAFYPWILMLQMMPVIVMIPVFNIWLDEALAVVVLTTFIISFFPVVANTTQGLLSADRSMVNLFRMNDATPLQEMVRLRLPFALPYYLAGLRIAASLATIGALTGEMFAGVSSGHQGLGWLVQQFKAQANTPAVFATAIVALVLGFTFVGTAEAGRFLLLRKWHDSFAAQQT